MPAAATAADVAAAEENVEHRQKEEDVQMFGPVIVQAQVRGAFVCMAMMFLMQVNYTLWFDYAGMALWAFVLSEALKSGRMSYETHLHELIYHVEDSRDSAKHTGVVHWLLQLCALRVLTAIWRRVHHRDDSDSDSYATHVWTVVNNAVVHEVNFYYDRDHDGTVSVYEVVERTVTGCLLLALAPFKVAVDNAPVAFTLYVLAHAIGLYNLLAILYSFGLAVFIFGLGLWGTGFLAPFCRSIASPSAHCTLAIIAMFFCGAGAALSFGLALWDLGSTTVRQTKRGIVS